MDKINFKLKRNLFLLGIIIVMVSIYFQRDMTPGNELKYMSIVDDAISKNNYFVFYNQGVAYADKPPLYFWIIMLIKKIFGYYSTVGIGLFSIIPAIITSFSMKNLTKDYLDKEEGFLAIGILLTTTLFLGMSLTLRMDILMTMFIVLTLELFYKIYQRKNKSYHIYLMYLYIFLGVFTKGPVGIIFPIITIGLFLFREKKLKLLKELKLLKGLTLLLILFLGWFIAIYLEGGKSYLYDLTINQTIGRARESFSHAEPFYYYFKVIWVDFLPWSLLFIGIFIISFKKKLENLSIERLLSSAIIGHMITMSFVSGKLELYLIPIYPFIAFYTMLIIKKINQEKIWQVLILPFSIIMTLLLPIYLIVLKFIKLPFESSVSLYIGFLLASIFGGISLIGIKKIRFNQGCWGIILGILTLLFTLSFEIPELNKDLGLKVLAINGKEIFKSGDSKSYYSFNFRSASSMDVYLGEKVINLKGVEDLAKIISNKQIVLFIRSKDIKRNKNLVGILNDMYLVWHSNKYTLYTNKKGEL